jgi:hypothetical protein
VPLPRLENAMKTSRLFYALLATITLLHAAAASAASIDMNDPRRVVGRENDIRVDAQLLQETVSPGTVVAVNYQIQNFTAAPVAVADRVTTASYDADTATITLSIGAEVPQDGRMPHVATIAPGEKKIFRTGATPTLNAAALRTSLAAPPRYVQIKVTVLRDLTPFSALINGQQQARVAPMLPDALFDKWFEANDTILLNTVPVRFSPRGNAPNMSADQADASSM